LKTHRKASYREIEMIKVVLYLVMRSSKGRRRRRERREGEE